MHVNGEIWTKQFFDSFRKWSVSRLLDHLLMKFIWELKPLSQLIWKTNNKFILKKFSKIRFSECIIFFCYSLYTLECYVYVMASHFLWWQVLVWTLTTFLWMCIYMCVATGKDFCMSKHSSHTHDKFWLVFKFILCFATKGNTILPCHLMLPHQDMMYVQLVDCQSINLVDQYQMLCLLSIKLLSVELKGNFQWLRETKCP